MDNARSLTRRLTALIAGLAVVAGLVGGVAPEGVARAAGPQQTVFLNAIVGPPAIDVYVDGTLLLAGLAAGAASPIVTLADRVDHDVFVYRSIANPPQARTSRGDAALPSGGLSSMPRANAIYHPAVPTVVRLFNGSPNTVWYAIPYDFPSSASVCTPGEAAVSFDGAADLMTTADTGTGGSGVFGFGAGTLSSSRAYSRPIVVAGDRFGGQKASDQVPYAFGAFDFGTVTIALYQEHFFFAYGTDGTYGAAEVVFDCATQRFVSARSVPRNPTFPSSRFVPMPPVRLFDTREAPAPGMPTGKLAAGAQVDVPILGQVGVPATGVSAVVLNVTATDASTAGFVTAWPTGATRPTTSNVNLLGAGQTAPNLVTVPLGAGGKVSFFSSGGTHLLADVAGYFVQATAATAGRFVPVTPDRLFDTREPGAFTGVVGPGASIRVPIAGGHGVPATGASAVVLNVTGVGVGAPGYITTYPGGTTAPTASNVNLAGAGDVTSNLVMVPLGADGSVEFFSSDRAHVVADVFGYFTGASAPSSASGLFVPTTPLRVLDSRPYEYKLFPVGPIGAGAQIDVPIADVGDVPGVGPAAVLANITGTQATRPGFITAWPSGIAVPGVSTVNLVRAGTTRPNAAVVPLGGLGDISLFSSGGTHALVDVFGYFTE